MDVKKHIISLLFIISSMIMYSQEFKQRHIRKLENLDIPFKAEYSMSEQATKDLHHSLHHDFKRKAKITVGGSLLTVGIGGLVGGALLMNGAQYDHQGLTSIAATGCFLVAAAGVGTSIPLFVGARKSKKLRDKIKTMLNINLNTQELHVLLKMEA